MEIQRWGTVISGFGPLLVIVGPLLTVLDPLCPCLLVAGPKTTKLTSLSGNQAFTFTSLTWILSRQIYICTVKPCKNSMHSTLKCGCYRTAAFPSAFPAFPHLHLWKSEVRERLGLKIGGGELRSLASYGTLTTGCKTSS